MWNLAHWDKPFIFFYIDAILFQPISIVNNYIDEKPIILIEYQIIPGHT